MVTGPAILITVLMIIQIIHMKAVRTPITINFLHLTFCSCSFLLNKMCVVVRDY